MRTRLQRPVLEVRPSCNAFRLTLVAVPSESSPGGAVLHLCPQSTRKLDSAMKAVLVVCAAVSRVPLLSASGSVAIITCDAALEQSRQVCSMRRNLWYGFAPRAPAEHCLQAV